METKLTKVRATATGFYGGQRRREGDEFYLDAQHKPSEKWMEVIEAGDAPKKAGKKSQTPKERQTEAAADAAALAQANDATNSTKTNGPIDKLDGIEGNAAEQKQGGNDLA